MKPPTAILQMEIRILKKEKKLSEAQLKKERAEARNVTAQLNATRRELQDAQKTSERLTALFSAIATKSRNREQGLKASLEMLKKGIAYSVIDEEFRRDYLMFSKSDVADYMLKLASIEDP